jgi:hypothetical protein
VSIVREQRNVPVGDADALIEDVARELRRTVDPAAALTPRVMAEIATVRARRGGGALWEWVVRPRVVRLSPAAAAAIVVVIAAASAVSVRALGRVRTAGAGHGTLAATPSGVAADEQGTVVTGATVEIARAAGPVRGRTVVFVLAAPHAARVSLAGDFNGWDPSRTRLQRVAAGVWSVGVTLPEGRYGYAFVVDGSRWVADPTAPRSLTDDFGRPTSVLTVSGGEARS